MLGSELAQASESTVLEVAILDVIPGEEDRFEEDFAKAQSIISAMKGYIAHQLQRCMEDCSRYILLVKWETLQDHTEGFRGSSQYQEWKSLLHHYYEPMPEVQHYELVFSSLLSNEGGAER